MIKEIGITGGIGSGKSTVARIFASLGFKIYESDVRAKALTTEDAQVVSEIIKAFGPESYLPDGNLDRKRMAKIVFNDPAKLKILNKITHPAVGRDYANWLKSASNNYHKAFVLKEAAILFETGSYKKSDGIISVYCPKSIRIQRVMARDGISADQVRDRMRNQWPDAKKVLMADFVIYNDGIHHLAPQIQAAIQHFNKVQA